MPSFVAFVLSVFLMSPTVFADIRYFKTIPELMAAYPGETGLVAFHSGGDYDPDAQHDGEFYLYKNDEVSFGYWPSYTTVCFIGSGKNLDLRIQAPSIFVPYPRSDVQFPHHESFVMEREVSADGKNITLQLTREHRYFVRRELEKTPYETESKTIVLKKCE